MKIMNHPETTISPKITVDVPENTVLKMIEHYRNLKADCDKASDYYAIVIKEMETAVSRQSSIQDEKCSAGVRAEPQCNDSERIEL